MKKIFFILLIHFFYFQLFAQPAIEWEISFGSSGWDEAQSIQQTLDGGYILAASAATNDGDAADAVGGGDAWIIKLTENGTLHWKKPFGGSNHDYSNAIYQTADGGFIVVGGSKSDDGDVSSNQGNTDVWIMKLNEAGNLEWEQSYGGSEHEWANDVKQTNDGGFIICGNSTSNDGDISNGGLGLTDYWVIKLNETGALVWEKSFGGSGHENAHSVQQTTDGGYIVAGFSESMDGDVNGTDQFSDYWIVKLDVEGNMEWENSYGGSNSDVAYSIQQTADGGYIIAGSAPSFDGDITSNDGPDTGEYWILKLNSQGIIMWEKSYGGTVFDSANSVQQNLDGGYITAGYTAYGNSDYNALVIKLDSNGDKEWQKELGGSLEDHALDIKPTTDGGYIFVGKSWSDDGDVSTNNGLSDVWVVKLSALPTSVINQEDNTAIEIYPNPSNGDFTVYTENIEKEAQINVFDVYGRNIYSKMSKEGQVQITGLPKGIFWIHLSGNEISTTHKIIVH